MTSLRLHMFLEAMSGLEIGYLMFSYYLFQHMITFIFYTLSEIKLYWDIKHFN